MGRPEPAGAMLRKLVCLIFCWLFIGPVWAEPEKPKLVVLILVDQFRADYLERFRQDFLPPRDAQGRPGGFLFLEREAAVHSRCFYDHWPTHTGVGHAAVSTGALPSVHGVVNNYWMDRETGRKVDVGRDSEQLLVGTEGRLQGSSPMRLEAPTIGDAMKFHTGGKTKVFGVAIKDRASVLATGRMADRALWFESKTGDWVTSTYYGPLPDYVREVNESGWSETLHQEVWTPLLPLSRYSQQRLKAQKGVYDNWASLGETFPHRLNGGKSQPGPDSFEALTFSPQSLTGLFHMARLVVTNEGLGRDEIPDLMTVGVSTNDRVGHAFGPYSPEVHDITLRTDRELANFFRFLDSEIGLQDVLIVLTSDHGVAPVPEFSQRTRAMGGRISPEEIRAAVNQALSREFGAAEYVRGFYDPHLYFDFRRLTSAQVERAEELAKSAVEKLEGVQYALLASHIRQGRHLKTPLERRVSASFFRGRSGDLVILPRPQWIVSFDEPKGTNHGSGWTHDTHVPLIVRGNGVPAGRYRQTCTPRDIAPTISEILKMTPPAGSDGELLEWLR